jgi:SAM-dependent methyltransferase
MAIILFFCLFLLFSLLLLFWIVSSFLGFVITRVPFVPTAARDIHTIAERVPLSEDDVIYDLGSGNGKVVFMLERLTGARTVGFETTLWTHWYALAKQLFYNVGNKRRSRARFVLGNFFKHDWSGASVVYCYLYPPLMRQVGDKVLAECKPGTRVIVRDFPIPNLPQVGHFHTYGRHEIFIYQVL